MIFSQNFLIEDDRLPSCQWPHTCGREGNQTSEGMDDLLNLQQLQIHWKGKLNIAHTIFHEEVF